METSDYYRNYSTRMKFKSYYVVWKPTTTKASVEADGSLNRTM